MRGATVPALAPPVIDARARRIRRGFSIHSYTGSNGGGKTLAAVFDALPGLAAGYPIVSTCRILDPSTGQPHPLWVPLDDFRVLLDLEYCEVILDEVTGVASSRESAGLPASVLNRVQQLRKGDVIVRWTTPNWRRADTAIREVTTGLTTCQGFVRQEVEEVNDYGLRRQWKRRRAALWRTYDAKHFDEWSTAKERSHSRAHRLRPVARQVVWIPWLWAREYYDTYEHALSLGVVSEAGLCVDCGGKRRPKACSCSGGVTVRDSSAGMVAWGEITRARRAAAGLVEVPETDDTPGLLVDLGADTAPEVEPVP